MTFAPGPRLPKKYPYMCPINSPVCLCGAVRDNKNYEESIQGHLAKLTISVNELVKAINVLTVTILPNPDPKPLRRGKNVRKNT